MVATQYGNIEEREVLRLREGDYSGLETLAAKMVGFVNRMCGNHHTAEDVVQETLIYLLVEGVIKRCDHRRNPASWLYTLLKNRAIDHFRTRHYREERRNVSMDSFGNDIIKETPSQMHQCDTRERLESVTKYVEKEAKKGTRGFEEICLVIGRGLTYGKTANALSAPIGTIKSRITTAREKMKKELENGQH